MTCSRNYIFGVPGGNLSQLECFLGPALLAGVIVILEFLIKVAVSDRVGKWKIVVKYLIMENKMSI